MLTKGQKTGIIGSILAAIGIGIYLATRKPTKYAHLWGEVRDIDTGTPIQAAFVSIEGLAVYVLTDVNGHYGFPYWFPIGKYTLICTKEGYADTIMEITLTEGGNNIPVFIGG